MNMMSAALFLSLTAASFLALFVQLAVSLVCYDASIIQRASNAAVPGPINSTSLEINCKVCLTLTVTQDIDGTKLDPNTHPIRMIRRYCGTDESLSCASDRFTCPFDETTFNRPKFILNNKPVPVVVLDDAEKQCECCDSNFCNGPKPAQPIQCNVSSVKVGSENVNCVGCMVERRTTWLGKTSETTTCQPDGCESYQEKCSSCDPLVNERCSCSCSINYPKPGYFTMSFVVPNKRLNSISDTSSALGYELSDAHRSSASLPRLRLSSSNRADITATTFSRVVISLGNWFFVVVLLLY